MASLCLSSTGLQAEGEPLDVGAEWGANTANRPGQTPRFWLRNSHFPDGTGELVEANGQLALKLTGTAEAGGRAFHLYYRDFLLCKRGDAFHGKMTVRGRGEMSVLLYAFDSDGKITGILPVEPVAIPVDFEDEFQEVDFRIAVDDFRKGPTGQVQFVLTAAPGSEVEVQSLKVWLEDGGQ